MQSPTEGFQKAVAAPLPQDLGEHAIALPAPVEARYVKLVFPANAGTQPLTAVAEVAVREGQAAGYVPLLKRHPDLAALLSSGKLPPVAGGDRERLHSRADRSVVVRAAGARESPSVARRESLRARRRQLGDVRAVQLRDRRAELAGHPLFPDGARQRIRGLVDFPPRDVLARAGRSRLRVRPRGQRRRRHGRARADVQHQDALSGSFKRALVDWVAQGHKLIIQDSDNCGENNKPDYSFLPFPFATSNPGARGAASALRIVESNFLASPEPASPAFFDEEDWRLKRNGNVNNDFGDSNTVIKYDPHWCGMIVGTNVIGAMGFVVVLRALRAAGSSSTTASTTIRTATSRTGSTPLASSCCRSIPTGCRAARACRRLW